MRRARSRGSASTTSISTTSTGSTRRCRSRRRSARWRSSSRRARCGTSASPRRRRRRSGARTRCTRSRRSRREYSLWTRELEDNEVLETVRELGIGFVAYSPLGRGFLTGRFRSPDDFDADDFRALPPALQGRELPAQPRPRRAGRGARAREGLHAGAARARLGALTRRRRRPDPRDEAAELPRGERRRLGRRADGRGSGADRGGVPEARDRRRPLHEHVVDRRLGGSRP